MVFALLTLCIFYFLSVLMIVNCLLIYDSYNFYLGKAENMLMPVFFPVARNLFHYLILLFERCMKPFFVTSNLTCVAVLQSLRSA
jgi:hypothetical protein